MPPFFILTGSPRRRIAAMALIAAFALNGGPATAAVPDALISQRAIAMQGLSIALGLLTLSTQFNAIVFAGFGGDICTSFPDGGSIKSVSWERKGQKVTARVKFYFDESCSAVYLDERFEAVTKQEKIVLNATIDVNDRTGKPVATFTLSDNTLAETPKGTRLFGTGTLKPRSKGASVLHVAMNCGLPEPAAAKLAGRGSALRAAGAAKPKSITCQGASAQDFPLVKKSVAALTEITMKPDAFGKIKFAQAVPGKLVVGALGALSVAAAADGTIKIKGSGAKWGTDTLAGGVGAIVLFPPKPTAWTLADSGNKTKFKLELKDDVFQKFKGSVTRADGKVLAPFSLDASGSGSITYSDGVKASIAGWAIAR